MFIGTFSARWMLYGRSWSPRSAVGDHSHACTSPKRGKRNGSLARGSDSELRPCKLSWITRTTHRDHPRKHRNGCMLESHSVGLCHAKGHGRTKHISRDASCPPVA